jgi:hypothetical protein
VGTFAHSATYLSRHRAYCYAEVGSRARCYHRSARLGAFNNKDGICKRCHYAITRRETPAARPLPRRKRRENAAAFFDYFPRQRKMRPRVQHRSRNPRTRNGNRGKSDFKSRAMRDTVNPMCQPRNNHDRHIGKPVDDVAANARAVTAVTTRSNHGKIDMPRKNAGSKRPHRYFLPQPFDSFWEKAGKWRLPNLFLVHKRKYIRSEGQKGCAGFPYCG